MFNFEKKTSNQWRCDKVIDDYKKNISSEYRNIKYAYQLNM